MNLKKLIPFVALILLIASCSQKQTINEIVLSENWRLHSSAGMSIDGATLSVTVPSGDGWIETTAPSTVLGALCNAGVYKEPFFGKNLENIPTEQFDIPWWYTTTFELPVFDSEKEQARLFLDGINYRANVWLNGTQILSADTAFGAFRQFMCDITSVAQPSNKLAVEIVPPKPRDFYMGFVDWAPVPPDHNMGIYRQVRVKRSGKATLDRAFVTTDVNIQTLDEASLTISTDLTNHSSEKKKMTLEVQVENITIKDEFTLEAGQTITATLSPEKFSQLVLKKPRLWWPNGLGNPEMYTMHLSLKAGSQVVDADSVRFGIRKYDTYLNEQGARGYKVNGREVLIKSAGWGDDLFLRDNTRSNRAQIRYVKEMNLNSLRFEGFWGTSQEIYDLCDENGIMLMVGWSCQWEWPDYLGVVKDALQTDDKTPINEEVDVHGIKLSPKEETLLSVMFRDQIIWLRNHPSIFVWAVGSDAMPQLSLEKQYSNTLKKYDPSRSLLLSAGKFTSELSGPTGMKMNGPYEYVPPIYWYEDKKLGGAFGFNSETGPGPQIPPLESIKKMIPEEKVWPPLNDMWDYHSGRKQFNSVKVYINALDKRYGSSNSIEELAMKAQWMNYEAIRPMFEAFVVNRPTATGVVQWQLNSAWPEFYWQLYDWYLMPTGAYFGTKKACRPINAIYNYQDHKIYIANDTREDILDHIVRMTLFDSKSHIVSELAKKVSLVQNTSGSFLEVPNLPVANETYFLHIALRDSKHKLVADNFYWLSGQNDEMDWGNSFWYYTPQKKFANLTALNSLPAPQVTASKKVHKENGEWVVDVTISNTSKNIAFCIEMVLLDDSGSPILPAFWDDNYISLVNDDTKKITVRCSEADASAEPKIVIRGVNIEEIRL